MMKSGWRLPAGSSLRNTPNALPTMLSSIYQALSRAVSAEGLTGPERAALAQGLNDRFSAALQTFVLNCTVEMIGVHFAYSV